MSDINLLDSFREEKKKKGKRALWIILILMVWIVLFLVAIIAKNNSEQIKSKIASISSDLGKSDEAHDLESQIEELEKSKLVFESVAKANPSLNQIALLDYFRGILPQEMYIYKYTLDSQGVCMMYGYTQYEEYLGELVTRLEENKAFKHVQLHYTKNQIDKKQSKIESFSFELTLTNQQIAEISTEVHQLKADFSDKSLQEEIIILLERSKKENNTLTMTYKLGNTHIYTILDYIDGAFDNSLKGYVIEHHVTWDIQGEFDRLYDFLSELQEDASIRMNHISIHTHKRPGLFSCTVETTYVGIGSLVF
ncbi:MAG: PilN domain-containing protein [Peptostreptococcales bacterium]